MYSIWIDLENAPHVPFFKPLIVGLQERGHKTYVTVRDFGYTRDLIEATGIPYDMIGKHAGKNFGRKVFSILGRVGGLMRWAGGKGIDVAVSHGSRSLVLAGAALRIPTVTMYDYEFVSTSIFNRLSSKVLLPDILPDDLLGKLGLEPGRLAKYPGLKEEVYLGDFTPDPTVLKDLNVGADQIVVVVRPPATVAHYHNPLSEEIVQRILDRLDGVENAVGIITPRTKEQAASIKASLKTPSKFRVLEKPVNGLNLIAHADLVVGGGGTMNREAAMLGVPVYSVFTGRVGTIDKALSEQGKLTLVRSLDDVGLVTFEKRDVSDYAAQASARKQRSDELVASICAEILETAGR